MYTSIYSKRGEPTPTKGRAKSRTSQSDQISISGLEVNVRPVLEFGAKLCNSKIIVSFKY